MHMHFAFKHFRGPASNPNLQIFTAVLIIERGPCSELKKYTYIIEIHNSKLQLCPLCLLLQIKVCVPQRLHMQKNCAKLYQLLLWSLVRLTVTHEQLCRLYISRFLWVLYGTELITPAILFLCTSDSNLFCPHAVFTYPTSRSFL